MRFRTRIDWDQNKWTSVQTEMQPNLKAVYREPWKLEV
jgi:hypothetical protein